MNTRFTVLMVLALTVALGCQTRAQAGSASEDQAVPMVASVVATSGNLAMADGSGPTVLLSYGKGMLEKNPIRSFMYFVPLISPVAVGGGTSTRERAASGHHFL